MYGCLSVLFRNPNHWTDLDEIWHGGGPQGQEGSWGGFHPTATYPLGTGCTYGVQGPLEPQPCILVKTL